MTDELRIHPDAGCYSTSSCWCCSQLLQSSCLSH